MAASAVLITATEFHFPSWFFHIFTYPTYYASTYLQSRLRHPPFYRAKPWRRCPLQQTRRNPRLSSHETYPPRQGCNWDLGDGRGRVSDVLLPPIGIRDHLVTCRIPLPLVQSPRPVPRNAQNVFIIRRTESHSRHRQRVPFEWCPHGSVIVLCGIDTDDSVSRGCRFAGGSEHRLRRRCGDGSGLEPKKGGRSQRLF